MSIERVREYFKTLGIADRIKEIDESSATVALAAKALGCVEGRIAKTISFSLDGAPILIVAAGDMKIDNAKYKARFGKKAKMLSHEEAAELIGHAVGGVCPFAVNEGVKIYPDESLKRFQTVFRSVTLDKPKKKSYNHIANKWGRSSAGRAYGSHP